MADVLVLYIKEPPGTAPLYRTHVRILDDYNNTVQPNLHRLLHTSLNQHQLKKKKTKYVEMNTYDYYRW
jgi:hypothetical protein